MRAASSSSGVLARAKASVPCLASWLASAMNSSGVRLSGNIIVVIARAREKKRRQCFKVAPPPQVQRKELSYCFRSPASRLRGARLVGERAKRRGIVDREVGENLSVHFDAGLFEAAHEDVVIH